MVMYHMTSTPKINEGLLMIFIRAIRIYKRDGIDVDALVMDVGYGHWFRPSKGAALCSWR